MSLFPSALKTQKTKNQVFIQVTQANLLRTFCLVHLCILQRLLQLSGSFSREMVYLIS